MDVGNHNNRLMCDLRSVGHFCGRYDKKGRLHSGAIAGRYGYTMLRSLLTIAAFYSALASGSQEGVLPAGSFTYSSRGVEKSGPVEVIGEAGANGRISGLRVKAFGKEYGLGEGVLEQIPPNTNGVLFSHEAGYPRLGGQTVYITFVFGFAREIIDYATLACSTENDTCALVK